jgi:hypothetical protein
VVANVRFKVRMRLRALIRDMVNEYANSRTLRTDLRIAAENRSASEEMQRVWRPKVEDAFPGCRIKYTGSRIMIFLPPAYPVSHIPICELYPGAFKPALFGMLPEPDF